MKREKLSYPFGVFFIAADVIAVIVCAFAVVMKLSAPGVALARGVYLPLLLLASLGGGVVISVLVWRRGIAKSRELGYYKGKVQELDRVAEGLRSDAELREEFIASFAHELKTPLTAIIGYADMLRSKDMAPKPRFTAAGYIFSEGKRLEALSLKLMDIIVVGKQGFETHRTEAGYFLREVCAVALPATAVDGIVLEVHADRAEVELEPDLFKTLLINLVDNARKASKREAKITLLGRREEGGYAFYVADQGRGMKKEELGKITEPFYMVDKSRSRAQNGAGLGLALCKRIAELHGTRLEYESEPGKGTTARVFLAANIQSAKSAPPGGNTAISIGDSYGA